MNPLAILMVISEQQEIIEHLKQENHELKTQLDTTPKKEE